MASPHQYQQPHPYVTQQIAAHAIAANAAALQQAQAAQSQSRVPDQDKPSFLTVRPSTRGLFYLCDSKWSSLFPEKPAWSTIAVNFEDASDEVVFWSINVQLTHDTATGHIVPSLSAKHELCRTKMEVAMSAKTVIDLTHIDPELPGMMAEGEFWWEPSQSQYPQLYGKFWRGESNCQYGPLDFLRTEPE